MAPSTYSAAYEEIVRFLTSGPSLEQIINFHPSETTRNRARYLAKKHEAGKLTRAEREEWTEFAKAEQFLEGMRVRAQRRLGSGEVQ